MPSNTALAITGILAALVGGGSGVLIAGAMIEPETIVETNTITGEVVVAPAACVRALDEAEPASTLTEEYGDIYQEFRDITMEALQAAFDRDADTLEDLIGDTQENDADVCREAD